MLTEVMPRIVQSLPTLHSLSAGIVDARDADAPALNAVVEAIVGSSEEREAIENAIANTGADVDRYVCSHVVHRDELPGRSTGRFGGVKLLHPVRRRTQLTTEQFARAWTLEHVPKALLHHPAMLRYATNLAIDAPMSVGGKAPSWAPLTSRGWDGFTEGYYRSAEDVSERFFDSESGRQTILADVARFLETGATYRLTEYVFV